METAQREAVAYLQSHSQVTTEPARLCPKPELTLWVGAVCVWGSSYLMTHQPSRSLWMTSTVSPSCRDTSSSNKAV